MRRAFARALKEIAASDPRLVLMTADLGFMVLEEFAEAHPSRFFNVGVAEANMVGLATGLASCGYIPYVYSIATFASMRPYEQIRNGPILHNLSVRIAGIGGGFDYGHAGFTHHALEDLGILRLQPGITVIAPADHVQAKNAIHQTYELPGPIYFRLAKSDDYVIPNLDGRFRIGRCEVIREGLHAVIFTLGSITLEAVAAATKLAAKGIETTLAVVSSLRPAPVADILELLRSFDLAVTVEEHYLEGGLGSLVAEIASENAVQCRVMRCGIQSMSVGICGSEACLREANGLSSQGISSRVVKGLEGK